MIYDVLTSFNSGSVRYDKDTTDPSIPIEGLSNFVQNRITIESTKLADIEKSFEQYNTMQDDILGIEIHNEDQYNRIKDSRIRMGISDDFFNFSLEDLSNTAKVTQAKNKVKRFVYSPEMVSILEEQKEANDYMKKVAKINSVNPGLAVLAKKDYIEKYGNKKERTFSGFELDINNYVPLDVDAEIANVAKDIQREYRLERDPNSPTGDGYVFINKVSGVTESGKEIFKRKMDALRQNKRFDNNVNSMIALNSESGDYNDAAAKDLFIETMMNDHLSDKIESVEVKKVELPKVVVDKDGKKTKVTTNADGTTTVKTKEDVVKEVMSKRATEGERRAAELRMYYEEDPAYKDYDFTKFDIDVRYVKGVAQTPVIDPKTGNLNISFMDNGGVTATISIPKMKPGQKREVLVDFDEESQTITKTPAQVKAEQEANAAAIKQQKEDVTVNNPARKQSVDDAGVNKNYSGGSTSDGKWVYKGAGSGGKVVVIDDPVNVKAIGLKTKDHTRNNNGKDMHLNKSTAMKAKEFHDNLGVDYEITEAGTDTLDANFNGHKNRKHYDGTAYDFSLRGDKANDVDTIIETMKKATASGLRAQFESSDAALVDKINRKVNGYNIENPNNKINGSATSDHRITGPHFSVYDDAPVEDMVKKGDVVAVDMAGSGNPDYAAYVEQNKMKNISKEDVLDKNLDYLKTKHKPVFDALIKENGGNISGGQSQAVMGLISQSKKLGDYLNKNPKDAINVYKFSQSPEFQEMYMDILVEDYVDKIKTLPAKSKFSDFEKLVILHTAGINGGAEMIKGTRSMMTGTELLKKHGFLVGGEYDYTEAKYKKALASMANDVERSVFKLKIMEANGTLDALNGNIKEIIGEIETNSKQYGQKRFMIVNPSSTAIGKYQIVWSQHADVLNRMLNGVDAEQVAPIEETSTPAVTDSLGRREKYNIK